LHNTAWSSTDGASLRLYEIVEVLRLKENREAIVTKQETSRKSKDPEINKEQ